jgi:hypothetical protein
LWVADAFDIKHYKGSIAIKMQKNKNRMYAEGKYNTICWAECY